MRAVRTVPLSRHVSVAVAFALTVERVLQTVRLRVPVWVMVAALGEVITDRIRVPLTVGLRILSVLYGRTAPVAVDADPVPADVVAVTTNV